jgi:hypothetical protein
MEMTQEILLDHLKEIDLSKISFTKAKTIFDYLIYGMDLYCGGEITPNRIITRVRIHHENEEFFHTEKDLSYNPHGENLLKYSRCSLPFNSMFYGAIDFDKYNDLRIADSIEAKRLLIGTPMFESEIGSQVLKDGKPLRFSIGFWELKKPLDAIMIAFNKKAKIFDKHLKENKESFMRIIDEDKNPLPKEYIYKFLEFISDEFAKPVVNHEDYKFSAIYSHMVLLNKVKDAIIYPSVKTETEGLCIAIKPNIIEDKCSFSSVEVCEAFQTGENEIAIRPIFFGKTQGLDIFNTNIVYEKIDRDIYT